MSSSYRFSMAVLVAMTVALLALEASTAAFAQSHNLESATSTLEACADKHLADERRAENPDVDRVLAACQSELSAVLALVPQGAIESINQQIRHRTDELLQNGSN